MVQLKPHPRPEQRPLLAACTSSAPQVPGEAHLTASADVAARYPAPNLALSVTAERALAGASTPSRPYAGISAEVVAELRADDVRQFDAAAARALLATPMFDPAEDPQPITALLERALYVMGTRDRQQRELFEEDRVRREGLVAARWIDAAIGGEMAETAQAIADAVAARPALRHDTSLLMALAPVVTMLKGSVA